ncbi:hypothetical protein EV383_4442 [Pseudonocardia sediminis]|uniref:Uncharacterized protein n=1 Tax=Pseudonocardia sediminis TaxID=1397368 RepID=A0A4Q7UZD6_PSEST|nr:hypothetical protein [Pseudonocardia sediminis]RZT87517.1 hypothetical protein EV383_4442 [Pseudonocardia sediminis]
MTALAEPLRGALPTEPWSRPWQDPSPDPPPMDPNPRTAVVASPGSRDPRPLRRALWEVWREIGRPITVVHDPACVWASEWVLEHKPCQLRSEPVRLWSGTVVERVRAVQAIARSHPPLVVASLAGHGFYERLLVDECRRHGVPVRAVETS